MKIPFRMCAKKSKKVFLFGGFDRFVASVGTC